MPAAGPETSAGVLLPLLKCAQTPAPTSPIAWNLRVHDLFACVRNAPGRNNYRFCYSCGVTSWDIYQTDEVAAWMEELRRADPPAAEKVEAAVDVLSEYGPTLGRPLVDTLTGSKIANLKELRPRQTMIRILFVFDPWRSAILLTAGDKTGQWNSWYDRAIPHAEELYAVYLKERAEEEEGR